MKIFISWDCSEGISFKAKQNYMIVIIFIVGHLVVNPIGAFQNSTVDWKPHVTSGISPSFLRMESVFVFSCLLKGFWDYWHILRTNFTSMLFKFILILSLVKEWGIEGRDSLYDEPCGTKWRIQSGPRILAEFRIVEVWILLTLDQTLLSVSKEKNVNKVWT